MKAKTAIVVSGKRKTAVARATLMEGTGKIFVNGQSNISRDVFKKLMLSEPMRIAEEVLGKIEFDAQVFVRGGGMESQIEAARLAIARALIATTKSDKLKKAFLAYDKSLLIADVRRKEAYKPGDSKARAKRQKSYR
ncbi:MAG: 30S ribosomal protein S9 [Nanoarchaeota archaeon]